LIFANNPSIQEGTMSQLLDLARHEFKMSIRRPGLWIANGIVFALFGLAMFVADSADPADIFTGNTPWREAGETVYMFNMLVPLIAGIMAADRMQRDFRLGLRELQTSTPTGRPTYILGKYIGVLLSTLLPTLIWVLALGLYAAASGHSSPAIISGILVAFVTISVPSFAFVVAFSLACPLLMPIRIYQILFTGYWFWGNFLNDQVFPTVSGTLLNASGIYAAQGFFQGTISRTEAAPHTPLQALLNLLVLSLCATGALWALNGYLAWQAKRA
jgi:ABC-type transport system involved in multi-copper enzyme maturation permease subunit